MGEKNKFRLKVVWLLPMLVLVWHGLSYAGLSPLLYTIYAVGIYPVVRYTLGALSFCSPFPLLYIWVLLLMAGLAFVLKYTMNDALTARQRLKFIAVKVFKVFAVVVSLFYIFWAFLYYRDPISKELSLPVVVPHSDSVRSELIHITQLLNSQRSYLSSDTSALLPDFDVVQLTSQISKSQRNLLRSWNMPVYQFVAVKPLYPKGVLLRLSTAGFYMPWAGEGYIDAGLHPLQWPFTIAHEMAHGQGHTDEGSCNFIGLITCLESKDPIIHYSGLLSYWGYLYRQMRKFDSSAAERVRMALIPGVKADVRSIRARLMAYPDLFPQIRNVIYDTYLKTHGVREGLLSYDQMVQLMLSWKKKNGSQRFTPIQ